MLKHLTTYKLGDTFKYVSTNLINIKQEKNSTKKSQKNTNEKYFCNIIRAKTTIKNLILCNSFNYFVTLTFNNNFNRYELSNLRTKINNKLRKLRKLHNLPFKFLLVAEQHKDGAWHFHGLLDRSIDNFLYINKNLYLSCEIFDYFGYNSFSIIEDIDKVSSYMTKYITKDFKKREKGKHLYFASQNLNKPRILNDFVYDNKFLKDDFFDYHNDYCGIKYSLKDEGVIKLYNIMYKST